MKSTTPAPSWTASNRRRGARSGPASRSASERRVFRCERRGSPRAATCSSWYERSHRTPKETGMTDYQGRFVWYELMVEDTAKAKDFYGKVLGWGFDDMPMPGMEGATYTLAKVGDASVAGVMHLPDEAKAMGARPSWAGHVAVSDVD